MYGNEKVVFIDINYIFTNSNVGKELNIQILNKDKKLRSEINEIKKQIEDQKVKILSQKNVLTAEEYNKKIEMLEKEIKDINLKIKKKDEVLKLFKKNIENLFSKNLNSIIEEYSVQNSIGIIFNKSDLLMAKKDLDITQEVLKIFNNKIKELKFN